MKNIIPVVMLFLVPLYAQSSYTLEWADTTNFSYWDVGQGIAVSTNNEVYVTGIKWNGSDFDGVVIKYNENGAILRIDTLDIGTFEEPFDITLDNSGNVYITGFITSGYNYNYGIVKFNSSGNVEWIDTIPNGADPWARSYITYDGMGNLYVTGNIVTPDLDIFLVKIDTTGNIIWIRTLDFGHDDDAMSIAYDKNNNFVYIAGKSNNGANDDLFIAKYTDSGEVVWTKRIDFGGVDQFWGVAVDHNGYVYAAGLVHRSNLDIIVMKFNPTNGDLLWQTFFDRGWDDYPRGIVVDDSDYIYVAGGSHNQNNTDILVLKYDQSQNLVWADTMDLGNEEHANDIALDQNGNIFITGVCYISNRDIITLKYLKAHTGVSEEVSGSFYPLAISTFQIKKLDANYKVDYPSEISIVDVTGRIIETRRVLGQGTITIKNLKSGVYWVILNQMGKVYSRRVVFVR